MAYSFGQSKLIPTANCVPTSPVFNVAVDPKMIPDHGTVIDRKIFIEFLNEFLSMFSSDEF